jgi:hypothetical protein
MNWLLSDASQQQAGLATQRSSVDLEARKYAPGLSPKQ